MRQQPYLLEFMLYPASEEPVLYELLMRTSWNRPLRTYNNTGKFMHLFETGDDAKKTELLNGVMSSITFSYQQNNDINRWLYVTHKEFCEKAGMRFNAKQQTIK